MENDLDVIARYRGYARELRLIAADRTPWLRELLLNAAEDYDRSAAALEEIDRCRAVRELPSGTIHFISACVSAR